MYANGGRGRGRVQCGDDGHERSMKDAEVEDTLMLLG